LRRSEGVRQRGYWKEPRRAQKSRSTCVKEKENAENSPMRVEGEEKSSIWIMREFS